MFLLTWKYDAMYYEVERMIWNENFLKNDYISIKNVF